MSRIGTSDLNVFPLALGGNVFGWTADKATSFAVLDAYAADEIGLDQLMAFAVCDDHQRQEQVFEELVSSHERQPWAIRRSLWTSASERVATGASTGLLVSAFSM